MDPEGWQIEILLSCAMDPEGCQIELRLLPGRLVLQKALLPLLKLSPAVGTAICQPNGISLQVYPEEQDDVFPILAATLRIDPASIDRFRCSEPITAGFKPDVLRTADEDITVTADYQRMEVAFALGRRIVGKTRSLGTDIPNNTMEIDDSEFVYAVVVGIASEDFRRIIRHFRHLSPFEYSSSPMRNHIDWAGLAATCIWVFCAAYLSLTIAPGRVTFAVEAFVTDKEVTFIFGPEEIVFKTENRDCVIGGINGYHRVKIRLSLLNPDSLLAASELSSCHERKNLVLRAQNLDQLRSESEQQLSASSMESKNEFPELNRNLYPDIELYSTGFLKPVVFLHGGPGGGTSPSNRKFFDPEFYRIILFDQRGAGKSTPHACLVDNTTWDLVEDIEKLREHLDIPEWQVGNLSG
ncbi:hypothetical protein RHGRI_032469 [Rhododendron griersonianum]|uniref:prolyl aminopeptidase n=1 Tax=Rhododendron griersonianum TaxID=479676 RepID=A0AAV6IFJ5_9ERIC|nr:hypothetical protein RHGRI_032469 [Rhododendron griersonianum]